jgi:PIN domain nuclease of toxin-antitoxin system
LILLDAYALVAFVRDEAAADEVEALMRGGDTAVTAHNLAEALDVLYRVHQVPSERVRSVVDPLLADDLGLITTRADEVWRAAELKSQHYKRRAREISLSDCILLAHGGHGVQIATADPAVVEVARAEDLDVIVLPDTAGRRP